MIINIEIQGMKLNSNNSKQSSHNNSGDTDKTLDQLYCTVPNKCISSFSLPRKTVSHVLCATLLAFSLMFPELCLATDFDGTLKGITITDSGGTNTPSTASIKFTQNGETFDFDASASVDPDGSITEYKWDFGDGTAGVGMAVTHQYTTIDNFNVTLTVVDNAGGVSLYQLGIFSGIKIEDDFLTDTSGNYISIAGSVSVLTEALFLDNPWNVAMAYHNMALSGSDHLVTADVSFDGADGSGLIVRGDITNKTGYGVTIYGAVANVAFYKINGGALQYLKGVTLSNNSAGSYRMRIEAVANNFKIYIDNSLLFEVSDDTYQNGEYIGVMNKRNFHNANILIDNLMAIDL